MAVPLSPGADYHWQAVVQENELIDIPHRKALVSLHCYNPTKNPITVKVVRTETGAIEFEDSILSFPHWRPLGPKVERPQLPEPEFSLSEINEACEYLQSTKSSR